MIIHVLLGPFRGCVETITISVAKAALILDGVHVILVLVDLLVLEVENPLNGVPEIGKAEKKAEKIRKPSSTQEKERERERKREKDDQT